MDRNTFTCAECGGTFVQGRPDEAAQAEAVENFGVRGDAPGMAIVCDACYAEIMARVRGARSDFWLGAFAVRK